MCSPPLLQVALGKGGDLVLDLLEGLDPLAEDTTSGRRDHVDPLRGARCFVVPGRGDEAFALERAKDPIEVAHVDSLGRHERLELLEELVAVAGTVPQDEEHRGLDEPLESGADAPAARADPAAAAGAAGNTRAPLHAP